MTADADRIRDRRRELLAPGGPHDRLLRILWRVLPVAIGALAAILVLAPLVQRGEISFLLDRTKVARTSERLRFDKASFRGTDNRGREFTVIADQASQASASNPVVQMKGLLASIELEEGPARLTAPAGAYDFGAEKVSIPGTVIFTAADGYRMTVDGVSIDLQTRTATGRGGVQGEVPAGTFSANGLSADLGERSVVLQGNARLRMVPGKLRMPQ